MKPAKKLEIIQAKIKKITEDKTQVIATYRESDTSVQAELRLHVSWRIAVPRDTINYPKRLAPVPDDFYQSGMNKTDPWCNMFDIAGRITKTAILATCRTPDQRADHIIKINAATKSGPGRREEAKILWQIETGKQFLADYRTATKKSNLAKIRRQIIALQAQQKELLPKLQEANSLYLAGKKTVREAQKIKNTEALKSGRFWEADKDTLKAYFHPPFDKNYLADVSEKWRAALFLECKSVSWKDNNDNWRHKLAGTGRGYLCGIDDNGDEWGHTVHDLPQLRDYYDNAALDSTVEEAMADLFDIRVADLEKCKRQGDLLFCPVKIRKEDSPEHCAHCEEPIEKHRLNESYSPSSGPLCANGWNRYDPHIHKAPILNPVEKWTPRESHELTSPSLRHNGRYFAADNKITVSHTSHPVLMLPPGEYRLYMSRVADPVD